ncbi:MAG: circularly permuted type 2 ATP-grasp protein [Xanthomonadales bacterium]|nr:circularly permuted type 2 ATP-grasp protein [Xanthomonadales bacterium]
MPARQQACCPALVFGQHGFLWPCQGMRPAGERWLHHLRSRPARAPNGQWWVIADRTQAPSGAGYALENRLAVSRPFPDMFSDRVEHP